MSKDMGEELIAAGLREGKRRDFVQCNVPLRDKQGEMDVIGTRTV